MRQHVKPRLGQKQVLHVKWWHVQVGFTVGSSALGGLLLIGVSWRLLFHITTVFAFIMAFALAVGMPDEFPYDLGGGGTDYNLGTKPTEVSLDPGPGKVSLVLRASTLSCHLIEIVSSAFVLVLQPLCMLPACHLGSSGCAVLCCALCPSLQRPPVNGST